MDEAIWHSLEMGLVHAGTYKEPRPVYGTANHPAVWRYGGKLKGASRPPGGLGTAEESRLPELCIGVRVSEYGSQRT